MSQVLQSLHYLHSQGVVHRDLKLENFLYSSKEGSHLKLIDFGFSKFFSRTGGRKRMNSTCGTLSYLAPEVLTGDYCGSTCDMWSAGVIAFVLLSGSMPFHGSQEVKVKSIYHGKYHMNPETWNPLSKQAKEFTQGLLNTNATDRLTAKSALAHPWLQEICKDRQPLIKDPHHIVDSLSSWKSLPKLRRACLTMLAWSLSEEERAAFRDQFSALDSDHNGTISYAELRSAIVENYGVKESQVKDIFQELAPNSDDEIRYSDFIAALMSQRIEKVDDSLLETAFRRFDQNSSGYITPEKFSNVVGLEYEVVAATSLLLEADSQKKDGSIDLKDFVEYVRPSTKPSRQLPKGVKTTKKHDAVATAKMMDEKAAQQQCCTLM
jgi:calcium-dependent protein kinase